MTQQEPRGLLLFSIGPVQDFIATARRTQDLWMGSYILAYLSYEAMKTIHGKGYNPLEPDDEKDPVLFPVLDIHPFPKGKVFERGPRRELALASLPNKFTVRVESEQQGRRLAKRAQTRVYDVWLEIASTVQNKIPGELVPGLDWSEMWKEQTAPEKWLEIYWVVYMASEEGVKFGKLNERAEQALAARKGVRNFVAVTEWGERDSLSGRRAALSSPAQQPRHLLRQQWRELGKALYRKGVKKKTYYKNGQKKTNPYSGLSATLSTEGYEYLSAIDMTKRFAQRFCFEPHWGLEGKFPSTSSIATAVFRQELLENERLEEARKRFVRGLQAIKGVDGQNLPETLATDGLPLLYTKYKDDPLLEYDGSFFYPETYTIKRLKDDFNVTFAETAVIQLRQNILALRAAAQRENVALPPTYYALIMMDGDKMGDHLAQIKTVVEQRQVSRRLMNFALQKVQHIVEDTYVGRVVYAGGDDLMAFLPIENVLMAAHDLNKAYRETLNKEGSTMFKASAGVVIAHHLAPLDQVLQAAREAEKKAKGYYGRNSIVCSVLKRSGERLNVGSHWDFNGLSVLPIIQEVYKSFKDETAGLSSKFAFDAEQEAEAITNLAGAHEKRLAYLLKRHSPKLDKPAQKALDKLAANLAQIGVGIQHQLDKTDLEATDSRKKAGSGPLVIAHWLLLARFLVAAVAGEV